MSDAEQVEKSAQQLFDEIYVQAFCKQSSARNFPVDSEEDLQNALESASMLKVSQQKQAAGTNGSANLHKQANASLKKKFGDGGVDEATQKAAADAQFQQLASTIQPTEDALKSSAILAAFDEAAKSK